LRQWSNIFSGSYPYYSYSRSQPQYVKYFPSQNPSVVLFKSSQQPVGSFQVSYFNFFNIYFLLLGRGTKGK
jgi:hypothetical protein